MAAPPFGTASAYTDSFPSAPPVNLTISAETCFNLTVFRQTLRQYRKMDDQIITRLNRAAAQCRDQSRVSSSTPKPQETMCIDLWQEMMSGWAHRQTMLSYCLNTVNSSIDHKKPTSINERVYAPLIPSSPSPEGSSGNWKEEEVVSNQLSNEEAVEAIIRKRSLDAFKTRCPYFSPPSNTPSKGWWDLAESGRAGHGPDLS